MQTLTSALQVQREACVCVCACAHTHIRGRGGRLLNRAVAELGGHHSQSCTWKAPEAGLGTPRVCTRHAWCCCQPLCACSRRGLGLHGRDPQVLSGDAADAGAAQRATRVQLPPRRRRKPATSSHREKPARPGAGRAHRGRSLHLQTLRSRLPVPAFAFWTRLSIWDRTVSQAGSRGQIKSTAGVGVGRGAGKQSLGSHACLQSCSRPGGAPGVRRRAGGTLTVLLLLCFLFSR